MVFVLLIVHLNLKILSLEIVNRNVQMDIGDILEITVVLKHVLVGNMDMNLQHKELVTYL